MKNRLLSALFICFQCGLLQAQNNMTVTAFAQPTCGCDGCITVNISNGVPPYTFQWSNGQTSFVNAANLTECGFCPGQYSVTVSNATTGMTATATVFVPQIPPVPINIISLDPTPCNSDSIFPPQDCEKVCAGTTVTYTVDDQNSSGVFGSLSWNVSGSTSAVVNNQTKTVTVTWGSPGTGTILVFANQQTSCTTEDYKCVTIIDPPKAQIGSVPAAPAIGNLQICKGQLVDFQNLTTGDADAYEWYFSDDFSSTTAEAPQHTFQNPGTHTITLIARSECLCSDTTTVTIEVLDAVAPSLNCVATICPGATVTYTASNACAPFSWTVSANGAVLEGGTPASDSITVQWNSGPTGNIQLDAPSCSGATCPVGGLITIPIVSDNAEIRGEERVCPGSTEVYSIESFGGAGYVWTLSGGGSITEGQGTNRISIDWQTSPNASTTYWLSVKYDNCYLGCGGQDSIPVKILSAFTLSGPVEACDLSNGSYTAKFIDSNLPISCNWTLTAPDGSTAWTSGAASANASVPFTSGDGYYRVFATPANLSQTCSDEADWSVKVVPLPAKLTGILGEKNICPGIVYTYEADGGTPTSNYLWTLQNGAGAPVNYNGKTLNVTWAASGPRTLAVAHVSGNGLGCRSDTVQIQVTPIVVPEITGTPQLCEDSKGIYTTPDLENIDFQWQISPATAGSVVDGQGSTAAEIFWSQPGGHTVNLTVCGQTAVFPVTVFAKPDPMVQHPAGLCPGATDVVQTATTFVSYSWKNESGAQVSTDAAPVLGSGNFAVEVVDGNGCTGAKEFLIDSWDAPDVSLTTASPTGFCANSLFVPLTVLTNADGNYTFQWFQDGVILPGVNGTGYTTNQYGSYTVQATNAHGCTSIAGPIQLVEFCGGGGGGSLPCDGLACPPGTADLAIDATARCDSFQMHMLDPNGLVVPGNIHWIVGISGGQQLGSSTDTDPSFTFDNAGEYVAILVVRLTDGTVCNVHDFFGAEAVARFDQSPACPGDATNFQDVSEFLPSGGISNYAWTFGDPASGVNNLSAIRNPSHVYSPSGNYDVTLTVTGASGCTSSATETVVVPVAPDVTFPEPAFKCAGNALEFVLPPNAAEITEIAWDFGDPGSGASNDASGILSYHSFSPAGSYTVTATATNVYGCTTAYSRSIVVVPNTLSGVITPPAPPAICEGKTLTLLAPAGGVSYLWSDENATTTPMLTIDAEGTFKVTLTDANGCTFSPPAVNVEMNPAPDALIKALVMNELNQVIANAYPTLTVCAGEDVTLQAVSGSFSSYSWSGGNGFTQIIDFTDDRNNLLPVGTHIYTVTVTDFTTGCTVVADPFTVTVNPAPSGFSISGTSVCAGDPNTLTYNGPQPANWQLLWNTGLSGPSLTTEAPGVFFIRVINEFGCSTKSNSWTVLPGPPVQSIPAGCHTRCKPDTLCLPNLLNIAGWQWFQNGSPVPGATSSNFIAQQSGTYWAELTDVFGCSATSDPLSLNLYDGYGKILGQVWSDVNNNGVIDAADTLVSGIPVELYQNGLLYDGASSGSNGGFAFPNILSTDYSVKIDPFSLPVFWNIVIGQEDVTLSGCDVEDAVNLLLHFGCQAFGTLELTACTGSVVNYQGTDIAAGSSQTFQYTSTQGCDSTLVVNVTAVQPSTGSATLYACPGSSADYNGTSVATGTTQSFTLVNWLGCDSIVTVNVQALPTSTSIELLHACPGGSANYAGTDIPVGSFQNFTLVNWLGCDSIVEVYVAPWPTSTGSATLFACPGGAANYAGTDIPVGMTQNFTLANWLGCDSIVAVSVQPWPTSTGAATLFGCPGSSVNYAGTDIPVGTTQNVTLQNGHGCDSVVTVTVQAWPTSTGSATFLFACTGGSATYNGVDIPAGTSQQFTLQTWLGCDSIVTVSVAALPPATGSATLFACPGGTATYAGTDIPEGTSQNFTLQTWLGCDSVVTVNVATWPTSGGTATLFACPGGSATYAGTSIPVGTTQNFTLQNWLGCDSIVAVQVAPWITSSSGFEVAVCPGETFVYQGATLTGGMVQPFILQNWLGCDSTVTVTVQQLQSTANALEVSVCPGEMYVHQGVAIAGGSSQDFHLTNAAGCDSTLTVMVNEFPAATFAVQTQRACSNTPNGSLEAIIDPGGQAPFQYSLNNADYQAETMFDALAAGDYQVYVEDANGCVFEKTATVPAIPALEVLLPNGIMPCDSVGVTLIPTITGGDTATLTVEWWNGTQNTTAFTTEAGAVWVEATDVCGTERSEAQVEWADLAQDLSIVYVPNVMRPASTDPENAQFRPLFASGITLIDMQFMVFDRWGNELFETKSTSDGWTGIFDGQPMNPGVQAWYLEANVSICGRIIHVEKKGDVTIVR